MVVYYSRRSQLADHGLVTVCYVSWSLSFEVNLGDRSEAEAMLGVVRSRGGRGLLELSCLLIPLFFMTAAVSARS